MTGHEQEGPAEPGAPRAKTRNWWLLGCGFAIMLAMGAAALAFIWIASNYRELQELADEARENYRDLSAQYPFEPPVDSAALPSPGRVASYVRAREAVTGTITPDIDALVESGLTDGEVETPGIFETMRETKDFLRAAAEAHTAALEAEQMSPEEYVWLHGWAVRDLLERPAGDPERERAIELLDRIEKVLNDDQAQGASFKSADFQEALRDTYRDRPALKGGALGADDLDRPAARLLHLITATPKVAEAASELEPPAPTPIP